LVAGTGNDTLTGAVGATAVTTFVFDDGFGNDIINAQTGNKDVLDFTAFSDLSKLTVSGDKKVITDTTTNPGHTITQNTDTGHAIVAGIDATLSLALQTAFVAFLADLTSMAAALENSANPIPQLNNQLPILSRLKNAAGKAGNLLSALDLPNVFNTLTTDVGATSPTFSDFIADLNAVDFVAPGSTFDKLGLGATASASYQGGTGSGGTLALLADFTLTAEQKERFAIDLGAKAELAGININANID